MNGKSSSDKGKRGEREVVRLYADHLGLDCRRTLAGHATDVGDLHVPHTTVEVKNVASVVTGIHDGLADLDKEWAASGNPFAVLWVHRTRARTHPWVAVMTPAQYFAMWREATA